MNGEVYGMIVRGPNEGGTDGIDIWGSNVWIHDVEVSNKDECVCVKVRSCLSQLHVINTDDTHRALRITSWSRTCFAIGREGAL